MKPSYARLAAEFKQKSRWSAVWPNMRYGSMFLPYGVGRQLPLKGVVWVTRESNRLTNFTSRYSRVIADIDVERNERELQIPLSDIRWNDHRRIYWSCSFCGSKYRKSVSVRTRYHAGCNVCKGRFPSPVLGEQISSAAVSKTNPELVPQLVEVDRRDNLGSLPCTSRLCAEWSCTSCGKPFRATIRSRTGKIEEHQATLHPHITSWFATCPACRWSANLTGVGERVLKEGQFLGLDDSIQNGKCQSSDAIPRRKKLVAM